MKKTTKTKAKSLDRVKGSNRPKRRRIYLPTSVYFKRGKAPIVKTLELIGGKVFADFDAAGELVGVEVL